MRLKSIRFLTLLALLALVSASCRTGGDADPTLAPDGDDPALAADVQPPPRANPATTGRVGLVVISNSETFARMFRTPRDRGIVILFVQPGGPTDEMGLERGDLITAVDGEPAPNGEHAVFKQLRAEPGETRTLTVLPAGGGESRTVNVTYREPGDVDLVRDYYDPEIAVNPDDAVYRYLRAQADVPVTQAIEDVNRATQQFQGFSEAISLRAELMWKWSWQDQSLSAEDVQTLRDRAQREWRKALNEDPDNPRILVTYSLALSQSGTPRLGHQHAEKALAEDPSLGMGQYALGLSEFMMSRYGVAAGPARRAIELNPYDVRYYELLARIFMRLDRQDDAERTIAAIIDLVDEESKEGLRSIVDDGSTPA